MFFRRGRNQGLIAALAVLVLAFAVSAAVAAEDPTRDEYKATVEPICKTNTEANERILDGVRKLVKEDKLKAAAGKFSKAAKALKRTRQELLAVAQPSADKARLGKWLGYVKTEAELFGRTALKLKKEDRRGANQMVTKLLQTANRANAQVLAFEFKYCRFEPSRFT